MDNYMPPPQKKKSNLLIPVSILIAGALIAVAVYVVNVKPSSDNGDTNNSANTQTGMKPVGADDHILGSPNADVIIVEYSDTECPFCKEYHTTLNRLISEYGREGSVAWVYRHFPITSLHSKAPLEAEATECAAELGGNDVFWAYLNRLFEITPSNNDLDLDVLPDIAEYVGLDRGQFEECLESGRHAKTVEEQRQDGLNAGARGTPFSVIISTADGQTYPVSGSRSYADLKAVVDNIIGTESPEGAAQ